MLPLFYLVDGIPICGNLPPLRAAGKLQKACLARAPTGRTAAQKRVQASALPTESRNREPRESVRRKFETSTDFDGLRAV